MQIKLKKEREKRCCPHARVVSSQARARQRESFLFVRADVQCTVSPQQSRPLAVRVETWKRGSTYIRRGNGKRIAQLKGNSEVYARRQKGREKGERQI